MPLLPPSATATAVAPAGPPPATPNRGLTNVGGTPSVAPEDSRTEENEGELSREVRAIIDCNRWLLLAFVAGGFFPPVGMPLQVWAAWRLFKAMGRRLRWPWLIGCGLPWLGLLPLKMLIEQASRQLERRRPKQDPLTKVERSRLYSLIFLRSLAVMIAVICFIFVLVADHWLLWAVLFMVAAAGMAGVGWALERPYHAKLRRAGYVKLWFRANNPIAAYEGRIVQEVDDEQSLNARRDRRRKRKVSDGTH